MLLNELYNLATAPLDVIACVYSNALEVETDALKRLECEYAYETLSTDIWTVCGFESRSSA